MIPDTVQKICAEYSPEDAAKITQAYELAATALEGKLRSNNHPFIEHVISVARIVSEELALDAQSVAAVFLHEASRENPAVLESYTASDTALMLASGLNKISQIKPRDTMLEADRYRKLIATYSSDPRVFIIKLADRLEIMRSLSIFPKADQARKNAETMLLYIPLAHQAGLYNIKSEMEDIWLRYASPEEWRTISNHLKATERDRNALMESFIKPLEASIQAKGIKYHLKSRTKSAYSIWKKMHAQNVKITEVYDVFAIRFIVDVPPEEEISTCWEVFGSILVECVVRAFHQPADSLQPFADNGVALHALVTPVRRSAKFRLVVHTLAADLDFHPLPADIHCAVQRLVTVRLGAVQPLP